MPGQRADFAVRGEEYETLAEGLLGKLSIPQRIPWSRDYGIDFNCVLRVDVDKVVRTGDAFCVQAGGPGKLLEYGGLGKKEANRDYEISWLKGINVPFFYARVTWPPRLELFAMLPVWRVLMASDLPFRLECELRNATPTKVVAEDPNPEVEPVPNGYGDCRVWRVDLGAPILALTFEQFNDNEFIKNAQRILTKWVNVSWTTLSRYRSRVAVSDYIRGWATNDESQDEHAQFMAWSPAPGANIPQLVRALAPAMMNLGVTLQWQHDKGAYELIPALQLLRERGYQSGLLDGLKKTQDAGLPPGPL